MCWKEENNEIMTLSATRGMLFSIQETAIKIWVRCFKREFADGSNYEIMMDYINQKLCDGNFHRSVHSMWEISADCGSLLEISVDSDESSYASSKIVLFVAWNSYLASVCKSVRHRY